MSQDISNTNVYSFSCINTIFGLKYRGTVLVIVIENTVYCFQQVYYLAQNTVFGRLVTVLSFDVDITGT